MNKNEKKVRESWFTPYEVKVAKAIIRYGSVKLASQTLGVTPITIYSVIYRMRRKITKSRFTVNVANSWRKQSRTLARLLVPYAKIVITEGMMPEEVELTE
jgi:hypothetical protein